MEGGEALVVRPAASGTPTPPETLASGEEAILGVGDAIVFDYGYQQVWHAGRTVGNAPVVMLFADLYDPSRIKHRASATEDGARGGGRVGLVIGRGDIWAQHEMLAGLVARPRLNDPG